MTHRNLINTFLLLVLSLSFAQAQQFIPGKVIDPQDSIVTLVVYPAELGLEAEVHKVRLNERNGFQFELKRDRATFAEFKHAQIRFPVFIHPERVLSIHLTARSPKVGTVSFKGPGKVDNTFYVEYFNFLIHHLENKKIEDIKKSRSKDFRLFVKKREQGKYAFIKKYLEENDVELSWELQQWLRNDITYQSAELLIKYPYLYNLAHQGLRTKDLPKKYYKFLETVRINNDEAIHQPAYLSFLEGYFFHYRIPNAKDWQYLQSLERQYEFVQRFFVDKARYYLQSMILKEAIEQNPEIVAKEYHDFLQSEAPAPLKRKIKSLFAKATRSVKGQRFPTTVFRNIEGHGISEDYFRHKITYVFFWSQELPQCKFEMRYLRSLARKFEEEEKVRIVLIATDTDFVRWKKSVLQDEYRLRDVGVEQLIMSLPQVMEFFDQYQIESVPEFFLLDHHGRIISPHTWAPSSGGAPRMIRKLLSETTDGKIGLHN